MFNVSKKILQAAVIGCGIPAILLILLIALLPPKNQNVDPTDTKKETQSTGDFAEQKKVNIPVLIDGQIQQIDMETYVIRVVLAEMPASFDMEALKAQAVASRTYALRTCADGNKHDGAVCTNYQCCQAYMTEEAYLQRGWSNRYVQRVREAVYMTAGQVLTYEGEWIRATYFSCSGGCTEAAVAVWGKEYPYLQSVKSPGEEETVYFTDTKCFTLDEFQEAMGIALSGTADTWFGQITYTDGGGVETMVIGGIPYRGTTLRSLLGLRSTVFETIVTETEITFLTKGYGHRVGMSQYGAEAMAIDGYDFTEILRYYYRDIEIEDNYGNIT